MEWLKEIWISKQTPIDWMGHSGISITVLIGRFFSWLIFARDSGRVYLVCLNQQNWLCGKCVSFGLLELIGKSLQIDFSEQRFPSLTVLGQQFPINWTIISCFHQTVLWSGRSKHISVQNHVMDHCI